MATIQKENLWDEVLQDGVGELASSLTDAESIEMAERYGTHNYKPIPVNIVGGKGAEIWDGAGNRYIDCIGAYSAVAHGHLHPELVEAVNKQLKKLGVVSRAGYASEVALFMTGLTQYAELDMTCPMNTGAEAVETCIKLARKWAYTKRGAPEGEVEIIVFEGNFHGRTTTVVGFSSEQDYREGFGPFAPGFKLVPFGDIDALHAAWGPNTCAVMAEPIQAEGGILIPPDGWMEQVRALCDEKNALLIWDEVQTGFCRTGKRFGWQHESAPPDLMAVGKPLGGGLLPVSAAIGKREVMEVFQPGDHGSTFGGNPLGSAVALTALAIMERDDFAGQSARKGEWLRERLREFDHPCLIDVRGRGLLIGLEVEKGTDTKALGRAFLDNGIFTKETRNRTFRLTPPIVISDTELEAVVERVGKSLSAVC